MRPGATPPRYALRNLLAVFGACAIMGAIGSVTVVHAEPTLRVRAQVSLEVATIAHGSALSVEGTLHDDLGARMTQREITATFHGPSAPKSQRARTRSVKTNSRGQFAIPAPCTGCSVNVEYAGDAFYERASVTQPVEPDRPTLRLEFLEPAELSVSLDQPELEIVVRASGSAAVNGVGISIENELARPIGHGVTGPDGVLRLTTATQLLGPYGLGELVARTVASGAELGARVSRAILRTRATRAQLRAALDPEAGLLRLEVRLRTDSGPVAQRALGIFIDKSHWHTLVTNDEGLAGVELALNDDALTPGSHELTAEFHSDIPGLLSSRSERVTIAIPPPKKPSLLWLLLPVVASIALVFWSARKQPPSAGRAQTSQPTGPEVRMGPESRGRTKPQLTLSGRVEDVDTGHAIDAAIEVASGQQLVLVTATASEGRFETAPLPAGDYDVRVVAPGYAAISFSISLPHHGSGSNLQVAARSLRALALDAYGRFAERVLPGSRTQGKTVSETVTAAVSGNKHIAEIKALAITTEQIAYARPIPFEADLHELQRVAAKALRDAGIPGPGPGDPDLGW